MKGKIILAYLRAYILPSPIFPRPFVLLFLFVFTSSFPFEGLLAADSGFHEILQQCRKTGGLFNWRLQGEGFLSMSRDWTAVVTARASSQPFSFSPK